MKKKTNKDGFPVGKYKKFIQSCWNGACWRFPCSDGWHDSFWKTVLESLQWKAWQKKQQQKMTYDMSEVEELGYISQEHFQDFIKFVKKNNL